MCSARESGKHHDLFLKHSIFKDIQVCFDFKGTRAGRFVVGEVEQGVCVVVLAIASEQSGEYVVFSTSGRLLEDKRVDHVLVRNERAGRE